MRFITKLNSNQRITIALAVALLSYLLLFRLQAPTLTAGLVTWQVFALVMLALAFTGMRMLHPRDLRKSAGLEDFNVWLILLFICGAALASTVVVIILLGYYADTNHTFSRLPAAAFTVASSWVLVHTVFTLHYAHLYYGDNTKAKNYEPGGLSYPGRQEPDYWDFAYFSFTIGMTFQVSDVTITRSSIRRVALLHGLVSFLFNSVILAFTLNTAISTAGR